MSTTPSFPGSEPVIPAWTMGDRMRKARTLTGMTVREFATHIGVSHGTVSNAETDAVGVRKIVLNAYSLATGVPVQWLETGIAPAPPSPDGDTPKVPKNVIELVAA